MSFVLKSVILKNIRAHEFFEFEPELEGITAIGGDNGAGKSTIVDSCAWSLYGTRPSGLKNKDLIRDGVDPKDQAVKVTVHILNGGMELVVERKILNKQGATECNVWGKSADGELKHLAGPGVSHVEKFLRNELGLNEKGFLTSVLIQQKQVDQIVAASPRERGAVIEELTGITSITQAISKTNENVRFLEKSLSAFKVDDVEEIEEKVASQAEVCEQLQEKEDEIMERFGEIKQSYEIQKELLDMKHEGVERRRGFEGQLSTLEDRIEYIKRQIERDKLEIGKDVEEVDTASKRKEVEDARNDVYNLRSKAKVLSAEINGIKSDIDKIPDVIDNGLEDSIKDNEENINNLKNNIDGFKETNITILSEMRSANESLKHLDGEKQNCPICKSTINDPAKFVSDIKEQIEKLRQQEKENNELIKNAEREIRELELEIARAQEDLVNIDKKEKLVNKLGELTLGYDELAKELSVLEDNFIKLEKEYNELMEKKSAYELSLAAENRLIESEKALANAQEKADWVRNELSELSAISEEELKEAIEKCDITKEKLNKLSLEGKETIGRKKLELERLDDWKERLERALSSREDYDRLANQVEIESSASALLAEFKADRIKDSIPTLEFYASDFLSKFTGGAFTKLTVDKKFNTFVTTSAGVSRPVALLSGGELSSAAIALRLGIAMLLNSSDKNVLILDEVLVSMDEDRSRQIMETISSMTNSQVIFIAHNTDINSIADKTVIVSKK